MKTLDAQILDSLKIEGFGAVDWMTYAEQIDSELAEALPQIECDYDIFIGCLEDKAGKDLDNVSMIDRVVKNKYLYSALDAGIPKIGFSFNVNPQGTGFLEAAIASGAPIRISYWDTSQQAETRIIEKLYLNQFCQYGTLRIGYKSNWLRINVGTQVLCFDDGAITRPVPTSIGASSNGLTKYSFEFSYERSSIQWVAPKKTKIPSKTLEALKF